MVNQKDRHKFTCLSTALAILGYNLLFSSMGIELINTPEILLCVSHALVGREVDGCERYSVSVYVLHCEQFKFDLVRNKITYAFI